jgi:hypothetical protein
LLSQQQLLPIGQQPSKRRIDLYIESRWGPASIRRFLNALIVPRLGKTYDAVFELTPAEFDAAFRQYVERRFRPVIR